VVTIGAGRAMMVADAAGVVAGVHRQDVAGGHGPPEVNGPPEADSVSWPSITGGTNSMAALLR
jgi:hypothetical protein